MTNENKINATIETEGEIKAAAVEEITSENALENSVDTDAAIAAVANIFNLKADDVVTILTAAAKKALKNLTAAEKLANMLANAIKGNDGKYIVTMHQASDGLMAYILGAGYKKERLNNEDYYSLVDAGKATPFEKNDFDKIISDYKAAEKEKARAEKEIEKAKKLQEKAEKQAAIAAAKAKAAQEKADALAKAAAELTK